MTQTGGSCRGVKNLQHLQHLHQLQHYNSHYNSTSGPASTLAVSLPSCCSVGGKQTGNEEEVFCFVRPTGWRENQIFSSFEENYLAGGQLSCHVVRESLVWADLGGPSTGSVWVRLGQAVSCVDKNLARHLSWSPAVLLTFQLLQ